MLALMRHDHRQSATREIERDLIDFSGPSSGTSTRRADRSDYEALKKRGCIEIFPLFLTDIRCEITEVGRATLLKYGIRPG
jgi:hypothetical protein